jgi:hypothetical protein
MNLALSSSREKRQTDDKGDAAMTFKMTDHRERALQAAIRRFPQHEFATRSLMNRSEAFRDMCEELSDAEIALSNVPTAPQALHEARRLEWQGVIDRLVAEVATALLERRVR